MTKYEELVDSFWTSSKDFSDKRREAWTFAGTLINGLVEYLGAPATVIRLRPISEEYKPDTEYTLAGAVTLEPDTYWHVGVLLTLIKTKNIFPQPTGLLEIVFKEKPYRSRNYEVAMDDKKKLFRIDGAAPDFKAFYEYIFRSIKWFYEKELERFLGQDKIEKIGF